MIIHLKNNIILDDWYDCKSGNVLYSATRVSHISYWADFIQIYRLGQGAFAVHFTPLFKIYENFFNNDFKSNFNFSDIEIAKRYVDNFLVKADKLIIFS